MNGLPTPQHYIAAAAAGYTGFRDMIVEAARRFLTTANASNMGTKELTDALWPSRLAVGTDIEIRKRMVDTLLKCATRELSMCAKRGPTMGKAYGHAKRPWLWSAPPAEQRTKVCTRDPRSCSMDHCSQCWALGPEFRVVQTAPTDEEHCSISGLRERIFNGALEISDERSPEEVKQTLVDCIGASPAGQVLTLRDRAKIADEIMSKTRVTIL